MRPKLKPFMLIPLVSIIFSFPVSAQAYTQEEKEHLVSIIKQTPELAEIAETEDDEELIRRYEEIQRRRMGYEEEPSKFDIIAYVKRLKERLDYEEDFRFYVQLIFVFLVSLFVLSFLANLVGLQQKVFWAFICGALGTIVIEIGLNFFFGFGCGFYILFFALFIGMAFALYVQTKK